MTEDRRIVLTEDDFAEATPAPTAAPAASMAAVAPPAPPTAPPSAPPSAPASALPSLVGPGAVRAPGAPASAGASPLNDARVSALVSAAAAMLVAWIITQVTGVADIVATTSTGADAVSGLWTGVVGVVFCATVSAFDRLTASAWETAAARAGRAVLPALGTGFVAGFIANAVWIWSVRRIVDISDFDFSLDNPLLYLARALGWGIFGAGIGVTFGLVEQSSRKAVNGVLGGAVGGGVGGLIFHATSLHLGSEGFARLVGLMAIGLLIAAAIVVVETVTRTAWLRVTSGGMAGKEFIVYHQVTRIGSSPQCEIYILKDPAVRPLHAQVHEQGDRRTLSVVPGATVLVNGTPVNEHRLRPGDQLQFGATTLAYAERAAAPISLPRMENPWT